MIADFQLISPISVVDSVFISSNVLEDDYAEYDAGHTYSEGDFVIHVATDIHKIYQSLVGSNTGQALSDDTKWLDCGNTNRWKVHDGSVQSQTTNETSIENAYQISGLCTAVSVLNADAAELQVIVTDYDDGEVYNETVSLVSNSGIQDWYRYFTEPIIRIKDYALTNLPAYAGAQVAVKLSVDAGSPANYASCGAIILGTVKAIGTTGAGAKVGITDYSPKTVDGFGNISVTPRAYRKTGDFTILVNNELIDTVQYLLAKYRATPIVYIGTSAYGSTIIYGYYRDFSITISYPAHSLCSATIEGLT
jgi:hypothetical protein